MKLLHLMVAGLVLTAVFVTPAMATTQSFPFCIEMTANGDQAHYPEGLHQIVAGELLSGSDDVYKLPNGNFLQCFCPEEGVNGIQTNWLDVTDLDEETIAVLQAEGWHLIENGNDWGLPSQRYLTKNSEFDCDQRGVTASPTPTPSVSPSPTPTPDFESSATPTPLPSSGQATPTPTATPASDDTSAGLSSSDNDARGGQTNDTSTPTPSPSTSQKQGEILGVTTLPQTGSLAVTIAKAVQMTGLTTTVAGGLLYAKKRRLA